MSVIVQTSSIILAWIVTSNLFNISSKTLSVNISPIQTTTLQLFGATIFGMIYVYLFKGKTVHFYYKTDVFRLCFSIGVALCVANMSMMFALSRSSVAIFQTVKASAPLFTAFACHVFLGRRYTMNTYLSLVPIMIGLGAATLTDISYDMIGLCASLLSSIAQVYINLSAKEIYERTFRVGEEANGEVFTVSPIEVQMLVSLIGCVNGVISMLFMMMSSEYVFSNDDVTATVMKNNERGIPPLIDDDDVAYSLIHQREVNLNLFINMMLYYCENILAYWANSKLSRLPFAVTDATRRLSIVTVSNLIFAQITPSYVNIFGVLAVGVGAILFTYTVEELKPGGK